jgi:dimethylhistidine N-methyltransferase
VWLEPFSIAETLVTNGEWLAFVEAGGYRDPQFWLADGWDLVGREHWTAPLYWQQSDAGWLEFGLGGLRPLDPDAAVTHVSYFEAAAYANWAGVRLPTEHEWERAVGLGVIRDVDTVGWQWTQSAYSAYPGFRAEVSAVGEYNGKFMNGQMVLRGGASVTPAGHTRPTYRNFYRPGQRWMFSAVRLAGDVSQGDAGVSGSFLADALAGLSATPKTLPPKYFYDARGSALFEDICVTDEYYPTRAETALLTDVVFRLARVIPPRSVLVEFGSGASDKTVLLLDAAPQLSAYVPIDVSSDALEQAVEKLAARYADLSVTPVVADFTTLENLPRSVRSGPRVGFFPGSTIGNLARDDAQRFLGSAKTLLGHDALFVVGVDLVKDEATLVAAYNDAAGVTAEFNKNMLVRLNRELEADFDLDGFAHEARWNASLERIEMHLVSNRKQTATLAGLPVSFEKGESIHTENSHKFTVESFSSLATKAGWRIGQYWISATPSFALFLLHA